MSGMYVFSLFSQLYLRSMGLVSASITIDHLNLTPERSLAIYGAGDYWMFTCYFEFCIPKLLKTPSTHARVINIGKAWSKRALKVCVDDKNLLRGMEICGGVDKCASVIVLSPANHSARSR